MGEAKGCAKISAKDSCGGISSPVGSLKLEETTEFVRLKVTKSVFVPGCGRTKEQSCCCSEGRVSPAGKQDGKVTFAKIPWEIAEDT
jgi:hypothetical protein